MVALISHYSGFYFFISAHRASRKTPMRASALSGNTRAPLCHWEHCRVLQIPWFLLKLTNVLSPRQARGDKGVISLTSCHRLYIAYLETLLGTRQRVFITLPPTSFIHYGAQNETDKQNRSLSLQLSFCFYPHSDSLDALQVTIKQTSDDIMNVKTLTNCIFLFLVLFCISCYLNYWCSGIWSFAILKGLLLPGPIPSDSHHLPWLHFS